MKENYKIGSIKTFLEKIDDLYKNKKSDENNAIFFRGHFKESYQLIPSIYRHENFIKNEDRIFREIISQIPDEFQDSRFTIDRLIKMQHYSVPTRLLDLSKNPLVALYFACFDDIEKNDEDGEVVVFTLPKNKIKYSDSDTVSLISNIAKRPFSFTTLNSEHTSYNKEVEKLIFEIKEEKPYFAEAPIIDDLNGIICLRPKLNNPRVLRQDGYFLLFGIDKLKEKPAKLSSNWFITEDIEKLIINKNKKKHLLTQLDQLNINRKTLFPELESLGKYIKNNYKEGIFA